MHTWAILITRQDDGQWIVHVPEIHRQRQTERFTELRERIRELISRTVDSDQVDVRFHHVSDLDGIDLETRPYDLINPGPLPPMPQQEDR